MQSVGDNSRAEQKVTSQGKDLEASGGSTSERRVEPAEALQTEDRFDI